MKGTVEMPELLDLPLCTPLYPRLPIWDITLRHVLTERGVGQAWWYTSTALITARMLNYAVRALLKWSLQDKQAILANMTPQRGKNFHRGLSNHVYLVCMNCSGVWNAAAVHRDPIKLKWWNRLWVYEQYILTQLEKHHKLILRQQAHCLPFSQAFLLGDN